MATQGTQDNEKTKQKHNTICTRHHYAQTNTYNVNKTWPLPQTTGMEVKSNRTSPLSGNNNGRHNMELRT